MALIRHNFLYAKAEAIWNVRNMKAVKGILEGTILIQVSSVSNVLEMNVRLTITCLV